MWSLATSRIGHNNHKLIPYISLLPIHITSRISLLLIAWRVHDIPGHIRNRWERYTDRLIILYFLYSPIRRYFPHISQGGEGGGGRGKRACLRSLTQKCRRYENTSPSLSTQGRTHTISSLFETVCLLPASHNTTSWIPWNNSSRFHKQRPSRLSM